MGESDAGAPATAAAPLPRLRKFLDVLPAPAPDTRCRIALDLLFGAAVPVILFTLELHWLPEREPGIEGVVPFRPYEPVMAFACVLALLGWYPTRRTPTWLHALAAGPLLLGGFFAGGIALLLSPLSFVGTLAGGIGILGFLPFGTAAVFVAAGLRALESARRGIAGGPLLALALLSATTFTGLCLGAGRLVRLLELRETAVLAGTRDGSTAVAESRLRTLYWFPGVSLRALRNEARSRDADGNLSNATAGAAWERITGRPVVPDSD